jgi:hypothetical protein
MRRCGCRRKRGLRMSGRGCVAAGGIGLSEGYDPAAVNRSVAVNRHSLFGNFGPAPHSRRGFFVRGRGHGNPQEFFGKRNFALLIVVYRSPFGIVRESVPSPGRLPPAPPLAGLFCASVLPCAVQPTVRVGVESAGLLSQPARASPAYEANLGPLRRAFCAPTSDFRHRNQRLGWPLDCVWRAKFAEP